MAPVSGRIRQAECPQIGDTVFSANPLLTPAIRTNVRVTGRCLQIPLLPRWPVLFQGVRRFGPVISFCGNSCGVLKNWWLPGSLVHPVRPERLRRKSQVLLSLLESRVRGD
jgi:hypothetical protein